MVLQGYTFRTLHIYQPVINYGLISTFSILSLIGNKMDFQNNLKVDKITLRHFKILRLYHCEFEI